MNSSEQNSQSTGRTRTQWMLALIANFTLVLYGLEAGWMSPMTKILKSDESPLGTPISDNTISLVASIFCMFAMFSASVYTYIADNYGRKPAVIVMALNQTLSWTLRLCWKSPTGLLVARAFSGTAAGGCFNIIPMYVKEISQDNIRGLLGSLLAVSQNLGILLMYIMGAYFDYNTILYIVFWIPLITAVLMIKAPESPAFLVHEGKFEDAVKSTAYLRGLDENNKIVQNEVDALKNQKVEFENMPKISLISIFRNRVWRKNVIISLLIIMVHASNGAFAIITYASNILASSGVSFNISPELQAISFPAVMIVASVISMSCIERFGRKIIKRFVSNIEFHHHGAVWLQPLLAGTLLGSAIAMSTLATAQLLYSQGVAAPSWLPVVAMVVAVFTYAAGILPLPFIIMSEMFNYQIRAKVMGLAVTYAWFMTFLQLLVYAPISAALGLYATFYCFSGINLAGFFICIVFLPETKGKSDEQIEAEVTKK